MSMTKLHVGECSYCKETGELCTHGSTEHMQPQVAKVFLYLVEHKDEIVTREELFDAAWHDQVISDESLTRCISVIRRMLEKHDYGITIETLHKRGYRLSAVNKPWYQSHHLPYAVTAAAAIAAAVFVSMH